jgi:capsular polysaccharide biosynthesis protein
MELKQVWSVVRRRSWLVLLPAVVTLILTLPSLRAVISPPTAYSVVIQFTASQIPASSGQSFQDQSYIPWLMSEYAVNNLATWMKSESFARETASLLQSQGKTIDAEAIRGMIQSDSARSIMRLYLTWPDPDEVKQIAQAAIDVLRTKSQDYFPQLSAARVVIVPLDAITVSQQSTPITTRFAPLFRILIGLVVGLALAFLVEYLDPTIWHRREVEALGLPILAEIPRH